MTFILIDWLIDLQEFPSYYEVIKKPVDLDKIQYRILHDQYRSFQEAIEDFGQMFENAAAFNEPTSAIYRVKQSGCFLYWFANFSCLNCTASLASSMWNILPSSFCLEDALVLLHSVMEKSSSMTSTFAEIPHVQKKVQEILRALMDSVLNFVKPDGRNVSETIAECSWNDSDSESEVSGSGSDSFARP